MSPPSYHYSSSSVYWRNAFFPWVIALVTALDYFDSAIFSFFSSYIAVGVSASLTHFIWVSGGYAAAAIIGILQQEWWVERLGHRRYIAGCMMFYAVGGVLASLSTTPHELLYARAIQGYFIGPTMGACRIVIQTCFTSDERPRGIRAFLMMILVGAAAAPLIGGVLVSQFGWRALFACTVPVALIFAGLALFALPNTGSRLPHERGASHSWTFILFAFAQASLQIVLMKVSLDLLTSLSEVVIIAGLSLAMLVWFGYHQWHHPTPLLRLHALREKRFRVGLVFFFLYYFLSTGFSYLLPRMLEDSLGFTIERTGHLIGFTSLMATTVLLAYFRFSKFIKHKKFIVVLGFLLALITSAWISFLPLDADTGILLVPLLLRGLLVLFIVVPVANVTFNIFTNDEFTHGYRLKNIVRQMAISFSSASILSFEQNRLTSYQTKFLEHASLHNPMFLKALQSIFTEFTDAGRTTSESHSLALTKLVPVIAKHMQFLAIIDGFYFLATIALFGCIFAALQKQID